MSLEDEKLLKAFLLTEEERQALFDSGVFNSIVKGYLIATLQMGGFSDDTISECLSDLADVFDNTSAATATELWNRW